MSPATPIAEGGSAEVVEVYRAKVLAELAAADRVAPGLDSIGPSGDLFAPVMLVKGDPGPAESAGGEALSGPDGEAARKALAALGFDPVAVFATVARPERQADPEALAQRLRLQVEAIDPRFVIALDEAAARLLAAACAVSGSALSPGRPVHAGGRLLLAVDGLEASLGDGRAKGRVWRQFRALGSHSA